jgi:hypothetical protein
VHERLDAITRAVTELKTPPSFGDQLYVLRDHVAAVRRRLDQDETLSRPAGAATVVEPPAAQPA